MIGVTATGQLTPCRGYLPTYIHTPAHPTSPPPPLNHNLLRALAIHTDSLHRSVSVSPSDHLHRAARPAIFSPAGLARRYPGPALSYVPDLRSKEEDKHAGSGGGDRGRQPWRRGGGGAQAEPVRVAEAAGLAHLWPVPAQPPPAAGARAVQRRARAGVPPLPRPVRQDQGPRQRLPLLRPPVAAGAVPVPAPPGLGQPRRARRPPPRRLRGARRQARGQPVRRARRAALPPRGPRLPGQGPRHRLREEAPKASAAVVGVAEGGKACAFPTATRLHACNGRSAGESARGHRRACSAGAGALLHPAPAALHARPFLHARRRRPRGHCGGEQLQRQQQRQQQWPQRRRRRRRRDSHGDGGSGGGGARGGVHAAALRLQLAS